MRTNLLRDVGCGRFVAAAKTVVGSYEDVSGAGLLSVVKNDIEFRWCQVRTLLSAISAVALELCRHI